jgi:hypothetical protein
LYPERKTVVSQQFLVKYFQFLGPMMPTNSDSGKYTKMKQIVNSDHSWRDILFLCSIIFISSIGSIVSSLQVIIIFLQIYAVIDIGKTWILRLIQTKI